MASPTAELVQQLIRNECVNDGTENSGHESRNADTLETFFNSNRVDVSRQREIEGRDSLVVRLEGSDKSAPTLCLLGHTDVVPAIAADWDNDPFGGEIIDGYIWGRGAIDMLNLTASMAVALKNIIESGFSPKGTIIFAAVADEEAGGVHGAQYLTSNHAELVAADFVLTESGGTQMVHGDTTYLPVVVGEKGVHWMTLDIEGTPSHGSKPYGSDNAIITTTEIISRLRSYRPPMGFVEGWTTFLSALGIEDELVRRLANEDTHDDALNDVDTEMSSVIHACCHHTFSPNTISGGTKINTVADHVQLGLDVRSLPGTTRENVATMIEDALGDFADKVTVSYLQNEESSISPTDTPLWDSLTRVSASLVDNSRLISTIAPYGTDARFYRRNGAIAYGYGLFSPEISYQQHIGMFHGRNERVDLDSLALTTEMYERVVRDICG